MKLSLVVSTLGRSHELSRLFDSLSKQTIQDFEVVIVDQNDTDMLSDVVKPDDWPFPISHVRTPRERGASRGRNHGWPLTKGEIVLFPDDDCWYPDDFLERALEIMSAQNADLLSGRAGDLDGRPINGRYEPTSQLIGRSNVWTTGIEWVAFFRREVLEAIDGFDVNIGIGAQTPWQSCEHQDIVLRAIAAGYTAWFEADLIGHHAELNDRNPDKAMRRKGRGYARGFGYVLRKHQFRTPVALYWAARPSLGLASSLVQANLPRARYLGGVIVGRLEGFFGRLVAE